jgi:hypothetical protein
MLLKPSLPPPNTAGRIKLRGIKRKRRVEGRSRTREDAGIILNT